MRHSLGSLLPVALVLAAVPAVAQIGPANSYVAQTRYDTGALAAPVGDPVGALELVGSMLVSQPGSTSIRLRFDAVDLAGDPLAGNGAELRIVSLLDGAFQVMNAIELDRWSRTSAYFNGDTVQVEVWARPGSGVSRVRVNALEIGMPVGGDRSICGSLDDRLPSNDPRSARVLPVGCTVWLIDDCGGCFLTAGHCVGTINVVQFNVPPSTSSGALQHPGPEDQYPIDQSSIQSNGGQGVGNDYAYFGTFPNGTTGLRAADAQGPGFTLGLAPPAGQGSIRITGYGTDSSPPERNQVQQTHVGPLVTNNNTTLRYRTDTTGGNSGSPVIWEETGIAVGIHTHGGCTVSGGQNNGTSYAHPGLQAMLADPRGVCASGIALSTPPRIVPRGSATTVVAVSAGATVAGSFSLHWRADSNALFEQAPMASLGSGMFAADLPAFECGEEPEFFVSAQSTTCGLVFAPEGGPAAPVTLVVGEELPLLEVDFESAAPAWTTAVLGATAGAWERGVPVNDPNWPYDPATDGDGSGSCYLTQNTFGNSDVDNGSVELVSPAIAVDGPVVLSYYYYLHTSNPDPGDGLIVEVTANGGASWTEVRRYGSGNGSWATATVDAAELASAGVVSGTTLNVRFTATDVGAGSIVEAGVDGFAVREINCDPNAVGTRYCAPSVINSVGASATLRGEGSAVLANNDLTVVAESLPPGVFGFVVLSTTEAFVPNAGGVGTLCIGGAIGRDLASLANTGSAGTLSHGVDWTLLAQPNGFASATVGEVWRFQVWYRDTLLTFQTSNYTDALAVTVE